MLLFDEKLLEFLIVGIANTAVGAGLMFLLYNLCGFSYWASSVLNYAVGGTLSFFLNKFFTFRDKQKSAAQIMLFVVNLAVCYFLAYFAAKKAVYFLLAAATEKVRGNVALLCGMCLYTALNYAGQRLFVFREKEVL